MANASYVRAGKDRRGPDRLQIPPCEKCGAGEVVVTMRTPYVIYTRCSKCGDIRVFQKPAAPPGEGAANK